MGAGGQIHGIKRLPCRLRTPAAVAADRFPLTAWRAYQVSRVENHQRQGGAAGSVGQRQPGFAASRQQSHVRDAIGPFTKICAALEVGHAERVGN